MIEGQRGTYVVLEVLVQVVDEVLLALQLQLQLGGLKVVDGALVRIGAGVDLTGLHLVIGRVTMERWSGLKVLVCKAV